MIFASVILLKCWLNGDEISCDRKITLQLTLNKITKSIEFCIINKGTVDIILSNNGTKLFKKNLFRVECEIDTKPGKIVSWTRPLNNQYEKIEFQTLVESYLERGIFLGSDSLWVNPVVCTRKKPGDLRFCLDLRKLNDEVDLDGFELPKIQELVRSLRDQNYFSVLDLKDGYFQVDINKNHRHKMEMLLIGIGIGQGSA